VRCRNALTTDAFYWVHFFENVQHFWCESGIFRNSRKFISEPIDKRSRPNKRSRRPKRSVSDYTNPFWTCHSSENLVHGLPLTIHKDCVIASCRFSRRAPIRIFWCKILDDSYIYRRNMRVNPNFQSFHKLMLRNWLVRGRNGLTTDVLYSFRCFGILNIFLWESAIFWNFRKFISESIENIPEPNKQSWIPTRWLDMYPSSSKFKNVEYFVWKSKIYKNSGKFSRNHYV